VRRKEQGRTQRFLSNVRDWDYLRKWLVLGALIGVVAGMAAIVFIFAIEYSSKLLLEGLGGYEPPLPVGEGNRLAAGEFTRPWAIPLVVGLGGLISGVLVFRFAPEAEGHGTDSAIAAIHHNPRSMHLRVTIIKLLSSAATIGSGGSAGREGPTAQISAGFGSLLAQRGVGDGLPDVALWVILLLPFVKIATTSLSIGSGGSGGIFGPGMVIGGFVGLGVWRILHDVAPGMPDVPAPFMVVGMIACFGSVAHAPLGLMLMVAEMTGSLALLPPAMIAIGLATVVVRDDSIYESQLRSRADAPGHRARFGLPLLGPHLCAR
jgi:H+/Cl- antiporter ClcA